MYFKHPLLQVSSAIEVLELAQLSAGREVSKTCKVTSGIDIKRNSAECFEARAENFNFQYRG